MKKVMIYLDHSAISGNEFVANGAFFFIGEDDLTVNRDDVQDVGWNKQLSVNTRLSSLPFT
jgi:hypothetical protein